LNHVHVRDHTSFIYCYIRHTFVWPSTPSKYAFELSAAVLQRSIK